LFVDNRLLIFFYIDDIVVLYRKEHQRTFKHFIKNLIAHYDLRDMGKLSWFLGIQVLYDRAQKKLWLCQDSYIRKIAATFNLDERRPAFTPISTDTMVPYDRQAMPQDIHAYQRKVGSSLYTAIITRPDIARTVSKLYEFLQNLSPTH
jgi:Reverse transcriptase (RNA-dependent DNA polymerase)